MNQKIEEKIELEELDTWKPYIADYFLDVLNGETSLEEARDNILSFRNTEHYTGTKEEHKEVL